MKRAKCSRIVLTSLYLLAITFFSNSSAKEFVVFDAMLFSGKPNLTSQGLKRIRAVYASELWTSADSQSSVPRSDRIIDLAKNISKTEELAFINIEQWPVNGTSITAASSAAKYDYVLNGFKVYGAPTKYGLYGVVPSPDYHRAILEPGNPAHRQWQAENDRIGILAYRADVLFPSLYTFYPDQPGWVRQAAGQIAEARRLAKGKPVYVFLWPKYHESSPNAGRYIPREYWRLQLEVCRALADGVVVWGGYQEPWNENAPWWLETKDFIQRMDVK